jgi:hypothetical protein
MIGIRSAVLVMGVAASLAAGAAYAEDSAFVGTWHWDPAKSTLPPGEPAPKDVVSEISKADAGAISWTVTIVTPDDQTHTVTFEADPKGEARRISSDTTATATFGHGLLQATFNGPAGQSDTQTCTVSADQKQMTCKGVVSDGKGHSANYVDVYDRM